MPKRPNQKLRLIYLNKILTEQTDIATGLTLQQLSAELSKYGIFAERKTLYDDIETLKMFGVDIHVKRDHRVYYYVDQRSISTAELKFVCDALNECVWMQHSNVRVTLKKISSFGGKNFFRLVSASRDDDFSVSAQSNAEAICRSVLLNKAISCRIFKWNAFKQRAIQFEGERCVLSVWNVNLFPEPCIIVYDHSQKAFLQIRIDHLTDIEVLTSDRQGGVEYVNYSKKHTDDSRCENMQKTVVRLQCATAIADDVINHFGIGITVLRNDTDSFEISLRTVPGSDFFGWVFTHGTDVEILAPDSVVDEYKALLRKASGKVFPSG